MKEKCIQNGLQFFKNQCLIFYPKLVSYEMFFIFLENLFPKLEHFILWIRLYFETRSDIHILEIVGFHFWPFQVLEKRFFIRGWITEKYNSVIPCDQLILVLFDSQIFGKISEERNQSLLNCLIYFWIFGEISRI